MELETKIADTGTNQLAAEVMRSFEAFKEANDARLAEIEKRMSADVVTAEKVERIGAALDALSLKASRPALARREVSETPDEPAREHKSAFESYVRRGDASRLSRFEEKALSMGSGADGGFLVPRAAEDAISRLLRMGSPIRAIASVMEISSSVYKKPVVISGAAAGWVGETTARPETASQQIAELQFPTTELYAMPSATQAILDDAAIDIESWIAQEVQLTFADQETIAFVRGDGVNKPKGFLTYTTTPDSGWGWGKIGYRVTGVSAGFAAANPSDGLLDFIYTLRAGYRQNARFVMNRTTQNAVRKFKDTTGHYLWQPALTADGTASFMGFPLTEVEAMPDIAADAFAIAFGDFAQAYLIVDRIGTRVLRDPYSAKPYVLFYTTKRVGGGVQNFEALKLLKFGTA